MTNLLNQHQAEAVASAMAALNNVGARLDAVNDQVPGAFRVWQQHDGSVQVITWPLTQFESHDSQNAFLEAYGL